MTVTACEELACSVHHDVRLKLAVNVSARGGLKGHRSPVTSYVGLKADSPEVLDGAFGHATATVAVATTVAAGTKQQQQQQRQQQQHP